MAINLNDISRKVMKLMQGSGHAMKMFDANSGKSVATPEQARFFYVKEPNMMVHIDDNTNELKFHIGEDVDIDNEQISNMMNQLKSLARTNMLDFDIRSFGKHIEPKNYAYKVKQNKEQTMTDHVNEGMGPLSGSSKTSRQTLENVRLILKHRAPVNEESRGSRSRNISAIFVETGEGERFKYPFIHLNGARAMARHVASGGETHDMVGEAIIEMSDNLARLKEFMNLVNKQELVNETNRSDVWNVKRSVQSIKEKVQRIQGAKGYANWVSDMALNDAQPQLEISEEAVDNFVQKFTKTTFEESLRDIFPLLHKVNEEEMENRRDNQTARVLEILTAKVKKTGEKINTISFGAPSSSSYDYSQIKKQFAEPRNPEEAAQQKINKIAMTFDDLADRVQVDTLLDKKGKKKGHDLAAEISFFLTDIANEIRSNPRGMDKQDMTVAGHLLKMSKMSVEKVEPKSADTQISEMLEEAFSKFDPDRVIIKEDDIPRRKEDGSPFVPRNKEEEEQLKNWHASQKKNDAEDKERRTEGDKERKEADNDASIQNFKPIQGSADWAKSVTDGTRKVLKDVMDRDMEEHGSLYSPYTSASYLQEFKRHIDEAFINQGTPVPDDIANIFNKLLAYSKNWPLQMKNRKIGPSTGYGNHPQFADNGDEEYIGEFIDPMRAAFVGAGEELGISLDGWHESMNEDEVKKGDTINHRDLGKIKIWSVSKDGKEYKVQVGDSNNFKKMSYAELKGSVSKKKFSTSMSEENGKNDRLAKLAGM